MSLLLLSAGALAQAAPDAVPSVTKAYQPELADQFPQARLGDTIPADPAMRELWARNRAFEATIYGHSAVLIYRQIYDQAVDTGSPSYVGFNRFRHERRLAGPDFAPFKSPNADTLYSNAYLDLRGGPVLFDVPETAGRYYTANFLDIFGNATNISARTHGTGGGRYLIAISDWQGPVPEGRTLFRVASPFMWILLRVLVDDHRDVRKANALQDRFVLRSLRPSLSGAAMRFPDGRDTTAAGSFRILDFTLRQAGYPVKETALVHQFAGVGIAGPRDLAEALADEPTRRGMEEGHAQALKLIESTIVQNGRRIGTWSQPRDVGRYGYNYLYRAALHTLGTGANVIDENHPSTTFQDADGEPLAGASGPYVLTLNPPPPARYFWSVTVYDSSTRALFANPARKYSVGNRTPGLRPAADGSVTIRFAPVRPGQRVPPETLPVPDGPFYVAIRAQGPLPDLSEGRWLPPPIRKERKR